MAVFDDVSRHTAFRLTALETKQSGDFQETGKPRESVSWLFRGAQR